MADYNTLHLLNRPDDSPTFFSRAWKTTTHPDLAFVTSNISRGAERKVLEQLATGDHKPVLIEIQVSKPRVDSNTLPWRNYKKADWTKFSLLTNQFTAGINCKTIKTDKSAKAFTTAILRATKQSIPRGARKDYTPNWSGELQNLNEEESKARSKVEEYPTDDNKNKSEESFCRSAVETNKAVRKSWHEKTESLNFEKVSSKLWADCWRT